MGAGEVGYEVGYEVGGAKNDFAQTQRAQTLESHALESSDKIALQDAISRSNFKKITHRYFTKRRVIAACLALAIILYALDLLFGANSLTRLIMLRLEKSALEQSNAKLDEKNQQLRKQIFEIRGLLP